MTDATKAPEPYALGPLYDSLRDTTRDLPDDHVVGLEASAVRGMIEERDALYVVLAQDSLTGSGAARMAAALLLAQLRARSVPAAVRPDDDMRWHDALQVMIQIVGGSDGPVVAGFSAALKVLSGELKV